jgi:hypothetical protein
VDKIVKHLGRALRGELKLDIDALPPPIPAHLKIWMDQHPGQYQEIAIVPRPSQREPAKAEPELEPKYERPWWRPNIAPEDLPPQIDVAELDRERMADIQRRIHFAEAEARLAQFEREQGLVQDAHNQEKIIEYVNGSAVHGYWSREIVDAAILNLGPRGSNVLHWEPVAVAPPPPAPVQTEKLGKLPNGEMQLSILQPPHKAASTAQLKDYLSRYRAENRLQFTRFGR